MWLGYTWEMWPEKYGILWGGQEETDVINWIGEIREISTYRKLQWRSEWKGLRIGKNSTQTNKVQKPQDVYEYRKRNTKTVQEEENSKGERKNEVECGIP